MLTHSKAFCSISTGVYGYPIEDATNIALNEIRKFLESEKGSIVSMTKVIVKNRCLIYASKYIIA